jgi:hypothetical protein
MEDVNDVVATKSHKYRMLQIDIRCGKTMKRKKLEYDHLVKK